MYAGLSSASVGYLVKLENRSNYVLKNKYKKDEEKINLKAINDIIFNLKSETSCQYKEMLIIEETQDMLKRLYKTVESVARLPKLFAFYAQNTRIFPSLFLIWENNYMQVNIQGKQRIINENEFYLFKNKKEENDQSEENVIFNDEVNESINKEEVETNYEIYSEPQNPNQNEAEIKNTSLISVEYLIMAIDYAERVENNKILINEEKTRNSKNKTSIIKKKPLKEENEINLTNEKIEIKTIEKDKIVKTVNLKIDVTENQKENISQVNSPQKLKTPLAKSSPLKTFKKEITLNSNFKQNEEFLKIEKINKEKQIKQIKIMKETLLKLKSEKNKVSESQKIDKNENLPIIKNKRSINLSNPCLTKIKQLSLIHQQIIPIKLKLLSEEKINFSSRNQSKVDLIPTMNSLNSKRTNETFDSETFEDKGKFTKISPFAFSKFNLNSKLKKQNESSNLLKSTLNSSERIKNKSIDTFNTTNPVSKFKPQGIKYKSDELPKFSGIHHFIQTEPEIINKKSKRVLVKKCVLKFK